MWSYAGGGWEPWSLLRLNLNLFLGWHTTQVLSQLEQYGHIFVVILLKLCKHIKNYASEDKCDIYTKVIIFQSQWVLVIIDIGILSLYLSLYLNLY